MSTLSLILQNRLPHGRNHQIPGEFPDNPTDDYDGDGLTEQSGDCDDLQPGDSGPKHLVLRRRRR